MLTVIVDARSEAERLPALLAQLAAGAVDGLVRQVLIVAAPGQAGIGLLCEETGADAHATIEAAGAAARAERLLILPADFRLRHGWIGSLEGHLGRGGGAAAVIGLAEGGLFGRRRWGVLVERGRVVGVGGADVQRLRRRLRLGARRIG